MTAVGVDVGGSCIKAVRIDEAGEVEASLRQPTPAAIEGILDAIVGLAGRLGESLPLGIGLAGLVDHRSGRLTWAPHLPGQDVPVRDRVGERVTGPVVVDNDANLAALAEHRRGAGTGAGSLVMITLGTGIGMGLIVDGEIQRGRGYAGEVGHVTAVEDGRGCSCGRRGCWETLVSGSRLDADARLVLGESATAPDLVSAVNRGNTAAAEKLAHAGSWLGWGIEVLVLALDPDLVVIGGAAGQAGDLLLEPARRRLATTQGAAHRVSTPLVAGILGTDAGAIGAALAAAEEAQR